MNLKFFRAAWLSLAGVLVVAVVCARADAQTPTAFTYQGLLTNASGPVNGTADLRLRLYDAANDGTQVGPQVVLTGVSVVNGTFTASADFGASSFAPGTPRWLEIDVASPSGGGYSTLTPRQAVTPVPLALGLSGIATRPAAAAAVIDQSQGYSTPPSPGVDISAGQASQSFTAGVSGVLDRVEFAFAGGTLGSTVNATLRAGGPSGPVLASTSFTTTSGVAFAPQFPGVRLIQGQQYTVSLSASALTVLRLTTEQIPGASGLTSVGARNFMFITFMRPSATIDAVATAALSAGEAVTARTATTASTATTATTSLLPWAPVASGIAFTGGNAGLGTGTPSSRLHVVDASNLVAATIESNRAAGTWFNIVNTTSGGRFWRMISTGSGNGEGAGNLLIGHGSESGGQSNVMVLQSATGNVGIGTTSPSQRLTVAGNVLANNVAVPSSGRFKRNVVPMSDALEKLLKLEGVSFDWNPEHAQQRAGRAHDIGFVAEEVAKVFPEVVFRDEQGNVTGMDYSRLTAVAVQAIKQQQQRCDRELARLDAENADLRARLESLERLMREARGDSR
jgi:hypothetical protein